jgi:hypothetical protein
MLKKISLALVVAIVGFVAVVASRPSTYRVERSITVAAPVDIPFGLVNDFHRWQLWSPWDALDPKMAKTFDGSFSGTGAIYSWSGNDQVGKGKMNILESKLHDSIRIQLEFIEPWASTNTTFFTFQPLPEGIQVTWAMEGNNDFMGKAFSLFMDMDGMIGKDFEKGLASIKSLAEAEAKNRLERAEMLKTRGEPTPPEAATPPAQATTTTP